MLTVLLRICIITQKALEETKNLSEDEVASEGVLEG